MDLRSIDPARDGPSEGIFREPGGLIFREPGGLIFRRLRKRVLYVKVAVY